MKNFDARKAIRPVVLTVAAILAIVCVVHLWNYYNSEPWTRDGRVRGDVIQVSSDVAGLVTEVLVQDNQNVKKGQPLFKIDVARQTLDVEQAKSDLAKAESGLAEAQAALSQAKANKIKSEANTKLADRTATRYRDLMDGAISKQEQDQVFATRDQSHAEEKQLGAAIEQAEATIIQQKALIKVAQSNLHLAELNMNRSEVLAPADGSLSNFDLRVGNYVKIGDPVAALVDRRQLYVVGYFEETKLNKIQLGDPATVQLMGDSQKIKGHVQGIASGIEDRERTTSSGLLANVNPTFSWVRLAQRVPVKIMLDEVPHNELAFVAGRTATVHILERDKK
ncbi:HlyD family secretion protein [Acinetobacter gerneri]|jgi:multidrug resistance efflux pump|uniref:HlyD family secretion protein n=1 Tax=Acinetobacter gerneri TaxID=202952 RepID=A0AAW8JLW9_9GAMM|nr:HlyD family secretion protein [Acinetobacter gerneri]MCH4243525.1 HlyD family secretion protein [Acinetobacter gerneri]MDQ9011819.1 HlyD family secretion protein [Acinetobacter gerneri]MDQ9015924.1 HlyD family secretion protein [Acinetobacter gerneri]MDQ9027081.1 HlyD family secretion protein [Acinetobacter gerneri]MDQ9054364.1 HlyD family secretion protein [Acinetobacter gerneri]